MCLAKAVSAVSFVGTLMTGLAAAWVAAAVGISAGWSYIDPVPAVDDSSAKVFNSCHRRIYLEPVDAQDLRGRWTGTWGYDGSPSSIEIRRVSGDTFYGTLTKEGAEIAIEGKIDVIRRLVKFEETRVIKLGPEMSMWSLGKNNGAFSPDGLTLSGTGKDQWGTYGWEMTRNIQD